METQFRTPTVSGAIRGTEFALDVSSTGSTTVSLFDGEVLLSNSQGELTLESREQALVVPNQPPRKTAALAGPDLIQWVMYYPAVLNPDDAFAGKVPQALTASVDLYRQGNLLQALNQIPSSFQPATDSERIYLAGLLLSAGQVDEAKHLLLHEQSEARLSDALLRFIKIISKREDTLSDQSPTNATEWVIASYARQARHDLEGARAAAAAATKLAPAFGFAWTRLAEMDFGLGNLGNARSALEKSLQLSPQNPEAMTLQGFIHAADGSTREAVIEFDRAIELDGALGTAWLGRGLTKFFNGDKEAGRMDLQMAATLEPQRSSFRSYLGKGFFETGDFKHAGKELELARAQDPGDPTPWLYSALLKQQENRINGAISDLHQSQRLNDNRAVYRSRLLLDQDQAVRGANLAAAYRDDGMNDLGVREASRAVDLDYANYSAHQFLANSYDALRDRRHIDLRYETPWLSEQLLANLLAPVNAPALSQSISQQEYSRLFAGNTIELSSGTEYQSRGDWRQYASLYGSEGRTGFAVDTTYLMLNGEAPNTDVRDLDLSAKVKEQLTLKDSLLVDADYSDYESGDPRQYYNPTNASPTMRVKDLQYPNVYIGYHREWSPGMHTLILAGRLDDEFSLNDQAGTVLITTRDSAGNITRVDQRLAAVRYDSDFAAWTVEGQQIAQKDDMTLVVGGRYQTGEINTGSFIRRGAGIDQNISPNLNRASGYAYVTWEVFQPLTFIGGVAYDHLEYPQNNEIVPVSPNEAKKDRWSPKAGIRWQPSGSTTLRTTYTRSLGGVFYDTSVRLEPTQIAGFNQAFRSLLPESVTGLVPGSEFETAGAAWDQKINERTFFSVSGQVLDSSGNRIVGTLDAFGPLLTDIPSGTTEFLKYHERTLSVSLDQILGRDFAVGACYRLSDAEWEDSVPSVPVAWSPSFSPTANRTVSATLHQLNLHALFNHPSGFFAEFDSIWNLQENRGYSPALDGDNFWQFNTYAGYRLARRRAELKAGILNLSDQDYHLNPLNLHGDLPRERTFVVAFKWNL